MSARLVRGFTLVELLVTCAIIVVITGVVLLNGSKFGGDVRLENFAYDVALSIRQTQVYGIAVRRFGTSSFQNGYGMRFATASPTAYIQFSDINGTGVYNSATTPSEIVNTNSIQQGYTITGLCVISAVGGSTCTAASEIDILYVRPEPNAYVSAGFNGSVPTSCIANPNTACYYEAQITLTSPKGGTRTVVVDATGQISVKYP